MLLGLILKEGNMRKRKQRCDFSKITTLFSLNLRIYINREFFPPINLGILFS